MPECHIKALNAESRYTECRYAECRGAQIKHYQFCLLLLPVSAFYLIHKHMNLYRIMGPYSKRFIFFVTFEWAQLARVLDYTSCKGFPGTSVLACWAHLKVSSK